MRHVVTTTGGSVTPTSAWFVGLDLGQAQDFTALCVIQRQRLAPAPATYAIRYLQRFPLRTPYPEIVSQVGQLLDKPERMNSAVRPLRGCTLGMDQTGVGRPIADLLRQAKLPARLCPVTITSGQQASHEGDTYHVPKKDLVGVLQMLLQTKRLLWDAALPFADALGREMRSFQVKVTASANETFGAWREQDHDDLVLAVAIACWLGERMQPSTTSRPFSANGMPSVRGTLHHGNGGHQL